MQAYDGHSEQRLKDGFVDETAQQSLSREAGRLSRRSLVDKTFGDLSIVDSSSVSSAASRGFLDSSLASQLNASDRAAAESSIAGKAAAERAAADSALAGKLDSADRAATDRSQAERKAADRNLAEKAEAPKNHQSGGLLDFGMNWAKDNSGMMVTMDRGGRLLTRDDNGRLVDYESHSERQRMASRNEMAFASILFASPLMLLGMGATFAIMDQMHAAGREKALDRLRARLDNGKYGSADHKGYDNKAAAKALLFATDKRQLSMDDYNAIMQPGTLAAGKAQARISERNAENARRRGRKRGLSESETDSTGSADRPQRRRVPSKFSAMLDRSSLSTKKLLKAKALLEEDLERMRGKASLAEVSRIETQIEKLDKALKRFSALGT